MRDPSGFHIKCEPQEVLAQSMSYVFNRFFAFASAPRKRTRLSTPKDFATPNRKLGAASGAQPDGRMERRTAAVVRLDVPSAGRPSKGPIDRYRSRLHRWQQTPLRKHASPRHRKHEDGAGGRLGTSDSALGMTAKGQQLASSCPQLRLVIPKQQTWRGAHVACGSIHGRLPLLGRCSYGAIVAMPRKRKSETLCNANVSSFSPNPQVHLEADTRFLSELVPGLCFALRPRLRRQTSFNT